MVEDRLIGLSMMNIHSEVEFDFDQAINTFATFTSLLGSYQILNFVNRNTASSYQTLVQTPTSFLIGASCVF